MNNYIYIYIYSFTVSEKPSNQKSPPILILQRSENGQLLVKGLGCTLCRYFYTK